MIIGGEKMKVKWGLGILCLMIIAGGIGYLLNQPSKVLPTPAIPPTPAEFLIERRQELVEGKVVTPTTTAELKTLFAQSTPTNVHRIFVDRLPDDFKDQGTPDLFAKVITALVLRENELIMKDRAIWTLLNEKVAAGQAWTQKEENFFNHLVKKYDSGARKTRLTKLADLGSKIDRIPPMIAVIQAAEATDWGKNHFESPYGQTGWLNSKTYDRLPFDSLIQATHSYAMEMNGMPPFDTWRFSRATLNGKGYTDVGFRVLQWLNEYNIEDPDYTKKLHRRAKELPFEISDAVAFLPDILPPFKTGTININDQTYSVELAQTDTEKRQGLMFRTELPPRTGMLFTVEEPQRLSFWMKNTILPLDVLFFDADNKIVQMVENTVPFDETPRRSKVPVMGFIEFPAGTVRQEGFHIGDTIRF